MIITHNELKKIAFGNHLSAIFSPSERYTFLRGKKILPHAYPFLMIDRVVDFKENEHLTAIKNLTANEWPFAPQDNNLSTKSYFPETLLFSFAKAIELFSLLRRIILRSKTTVILQSSAILIARFFLPNRRAEAVLTTTLLLRKSVVLRSRIIEAAAQAALVFIRTPRLFPLRKVYCYKGLKIAGKLSPKAIFLNLIRKDNRLYETRE